LRIQVGSVELRIFPYVDADIEPEIPIDLELVTVHLADEIIKVLGRQHAQEDKIEVDKE
jgi:hypothetical protein